MTDSIAAIGQAYLDFASTEVKREGGKPRTASTMSSYRRAIEGFVAAVEQSGLELTALPEDFVETKWLATQASVAAQPVQLRVRATAVAMFLKWLYVKNIPCAPMRNLNISTAKLSPTSQPKESPMSTTLHDVSQLADPSREENPLPSTQSNPPAIQFMVPPPASQRVMQQPQAQQQGRPAPRANPLSTMLPAGGYKLRVRREREGGEDPAFIGDYPSDRVQMAGAIEPFLAREVGPVMQKQGFVGDVSFIVCAVGPNAVEGEKARYTISIANNSPAAAPLHQIAATSTREELADMLATSRRAAEELEERMAQRFGTQQQQQQQTAQQAPPERESMSEMDDLKQMVRGLAGTVRELAERMESRDSRAQQEQAPAPAPAPVPQLDILRVIEAVDGMAQRRSPAQAAPAPQAMGFAEMMKLMGEMKTTFQPQTVHVDVSELEEQMKEMRREAAAAKPKGLGEVMREFKELKELFQAVGGETSNPKPTGFGAALGGMLMKFIENPTPIAEAAEKVLNAARGVAGAGQTTTQQATSQIPTQAVEATKALLAAQDANGLVLAAHEWLSTLANIPAFTKPVQTISNLLREGKVNELGIYLQQVLKHLGAQVPAERCANIAQVLISQLPGVKQEALADGEEEGSEEGEEGEEEGEEEQAPAGEPDMTVRLSGHAQEEAQEEEQEEESDEAEDGAEEGEDTEEEGEEEVEEEAGPAEIAPPAEPVQAEAEAAATPEELEAAMSTSAPVELTKKERRALRKAEKAAAVMSATVQKFDKPMART